MKLNLESRLGAFRCERELELRALSRGTELSLFIRVIRLGTKPSYLDEGMNHEMTLTLRNGYGLMCNLQR